MCMRECVWEGDTNNHISKHLHAGMYEALQLSWGSWLWLANRSVLPLCVCVC